MRVDERTVAHTTGVEELMRYEVERIFTSCAPRARRELQTSAGIHQTCRACIYATGEVAPCRIRTYESQAAGHVLHLTLELVAYALRHGQHTTCLVAVTLVAPRCGPVVSDALLFRPRHFCKILLRSEEVLVQTAVRCLALCGGQAVKLLVGPHERTHRREHLTHIGRQCGGVERLPCRLHYVEQCRSRALIVLLLFQSVLRVLNIEITGKEIHLRLSSVVVGLEYGIEVVLIEPALGCGDVYSVIGVLRAVVSTGIEVVHQGVVYLVVLLVEILATVLVERRCDGHLETGVQLGIVTHILALLPLIVGGFRDGIRGEVAHPSLIPVGIRPGARIYKLAGGIVEAQQVERFVTVTQPVFRGLHLVQQLRIGIRGPHSRCTVIYVGIMRVKRGTVATEILHTHVMCIDEVAVAPEQGIVLCYRRFVSIRLAQ